jgi:hypothetical protein
VRSTVATSLRTALQAVNAAFAGLPVTVQEMIEVPCDGLDRELDAAILSGDTGRALAAIRAWRDHWLHEIEKATPAP